MKNKPLGLTYFVLLFIPAHFIISCSPPPDFSKEIKALSDLQKQEQAAHLEEQPALLVNMLNDTLCQVKDGAVTYFTKDEMTERFISYFASVEFIKWEDIQPPVYTLSADGTMAHILIRKIVEANYIQDTTTTRETTEFAWTELWKKKDGRWKMYMVTTTDSERARE